MTLLKSGTDSGVEARMQELVKVNILDVREQGMDSELRNQLFKQK